MDDIEHSNGHHAAAEAWEDANLWKIALVVFHSHTRQEGTDTLSVIRGTQVSRWTKFGGDVCLRGFGDWS